MQFLGGPNAGVMKTFQIRWPDENQANRQSIATEIIERTGSKTNHKVIKASQLKSNLKVGGYISINSS